jgi:hypothetical protein
MNRNKPRLEPNPSFDLCRLACSIYDFLIDEKEDQEYQDEKQNNDEKKDFDDLFNLISELCNDDDGNSVLYKKNGQERYAGFKLYRMIARTVHKHTPEDQLKLPYFKQFEIESNTIDSTNIVMNIDDFPALI